MILWQTNFDKKNITCLVVFETNLKKKNESPAPHWNLRTGLYFRSPTGIHIYIYVRRRDPFSAIKASPCDETVTTVHGR